MCNYLIEYKYLVIILIVLYGDLYHNLSLKMKWKALSCLCNKAVQQQIWYTKCSKAGHTQIFFRSAKKSGRFLYPHYMTRMD